MCGVDATECHGQRVLCIGGRADLATEVSREVPPDLDADAAVFRILEASVKRFTLFVRCLIPLNLLCF